MIVYWEGDTDAMTQTEQCGNTKGWMDRGGAGGGGGFAATC